MDIYKNRAALSGLAPDELEAALSPLPRYRALQVFKWIAKGVSSFDAMSSLPRALREELAGRFVLRSSAVTGRYDGGSALKLRVGLEDGAQIEAVLLRDKKDRRTACLSTQAGCPAGCVFCKTGSLGFMRNLTSAEIVEQFLFLRDSADPGKTAGPSDSSAHAVANIVVMGMGEPLLNLAGLRGALSVITSAGGIGFSKRRITVSTCGITGGIVDIADNGPAVRLALSLTTADEDLRRRLMPITARHPLGGVKEALRHFQQKGGGRVTLEAALLGGINTRPADARALAGFADGLDAVVNLINWNPVEGLKFEGSPLRPPSPGETAAFARRLESLGLKVTRRFRKGSAVRGACGQLGILPGENAAPSPERRS